MQLFTSSFAVVPDPRADNSRHDLIEILFVAFVSILCGCKTCVEIVEFAEAKKQFFAKILTLKHGVSSHDTFSSVFRILDPKALDEAFRKFMAAFGMALAERGIIAIDGKALKGAYEKGRKHAPKMMVSAFAAEMRMTLASLEAKGRNADPARSPCSPCAVCSQPLGDDDIDARNRPHVGHQLPSHAEPLRHVSLRAVPARAGSRQKNDMTGTRSSRQTSSRSSCGNSKLRLTPNGLEVRARISRICWLTMSRSARQGHQHSQSTCIAYGGRKRWSDCTAQWSLNDRQLDSDALATGRLHWTRSQPIKVKSSAYWGEDVNGTCLRIWHRADDPRRIVKMVGYPTYTRSAGTNPWAGRGGRR
jgi:hypothetical protein